MRFLRGCKSTRVAIFGFSASRGLKMTAVYDFVELLRLGCRSLWCVMLARTTCSWALLLELIGRVEILHSKLGLHIVEGLLLVNDATSGSSDSTLAPMQLFLELMRQFLISCAQVAIVTITQLGGLPFSLEPWVVRHRTANKSRLRNWLSYGQGRLSTRLHQRVF